MVDAKHIQFSDDCILNYSDEWVDLIVSATWSEDDEPHTVTFNIKHLAPKHKYQVPVHQLCKPYSGSKLTYTLDSVAAAEQTEILKKRESNEREINEREIKKREWKPCKYVSKAGSVMTLTNDKLRGFQYLKHVFRGVFCSNMILLLLLVALGIIMLAVVCLLASGVIHGKS